MSHVEHVDRFVVSIAELNVQVESLAVSGLGCVGVAVRPCKFAQDGEPVGDDLWSLQPAGVIQAALYSVERPFVLLGHAGRSCTDVAQRECWSRSSPMSIASAKAVSNCARHSSGRSSYFARLPAAAWIQAVVASSEADALARA